MKTPEQIITEAVDKVCQDRKELKFGCKVVVEVLFKKNMTVTIDSSIRVGKGNNSVVFDDSDVCQIIEILGSPITLPMILRTIGDEPQNFFYYSTEEIRMDYLDKNDKIVEVWWNLKEDNLDAQSSQCRQSIAELLG